MIGIGIMEELMRRVGETQNYKQAFKVTTARVRTPMLSTGMTVEKKDSIDTMETMLYIADIFMVGEMQRYAAMVKTYCTENGLYRQVAKKRVNAMMEMMNVRQQHLAQYEYDVLFSYVTASFPEYKAEFYKAGGSATKQLQKRINEQTGDGFYRIFDTYRSLFSEKGVSHPELVAAVYTIAEMASMGRNIATSIVRDMELVGNGFSTTRDVHIEMFDRVSVCGREVLRSLGVEDAVKIDREELSDIQNIFDNIQSILVSGNLCISFLRAMGQLSGAYIDFCVGKLALTLKREFCITGKPGIRLQKMLGPIGVSALVAQLLSYSIPDDAEVWDVIDIIGNYKEGSALFRFAQECYKEIHFLHSLARIDKEQASVNNTNKNTLN